MKRYVHQVFQPFAQRLTLFRLNEEQHETAPAGTARLRYATIVLPSAVMARLGALGRR